MHLLTVPSNASISDNYASVFLARGCKRIGEQNLDEKECLHVEKYKEEEIRKMIHSGKFQQDVHVKHGSWQRK